MTRAPTRLMPGNGDHVPLSGVVLVDTADPPHESRRIRHTILGRAGARLPSRPT